MQAKSWLSVPLAVAATALFGQAAFPTDYPVDARALNAEEIQAHLSGKKFTASPSDGTTMRLEFKEGGYVFVDTSRGYRDSGKWKVEATQWCAHMQKTGASCSELRIKGDVLYYKRVSNGEVVPWFCGSEREV